MAEFNKIHSFSDIFIIFLYYILTYILAHNYIIKIVGDRKLRQLVRYSFLIKNAIAVLFVFFTWYKYGYLMDMGSYFLEVKKIASVLFRESNISIFDIYFNPDYVNRNSNLLIKRIGGDTTSTMPLLVLPFYYLGCGSIFGMIFTINFFVFISTTYLYRVFVKVYPKYKKEIIIALFCLPSLMLWAGGIYKDTLAYIGLCFLMYALFMFFIQQKYYPKYIILMTASSYLILITKPHILIIYAFIGLWILGNYARRLSPVLRYGFYGFGLLLLLVGGQFAIKKIAQSQLDAAKFTDVKKVTAIVDGFNNYYSNEDAQGGSQYSIGTFEPTLQGLFRLMPAGYNVTFYRPYLWEFRSPVFVFNVVESFVLLSMSIYIFFKWRFRVFIEIFSKEFLTFCFLYTLVLGAIIGIMSFNFGTLARYKTPVMPFFAFMIFVLFAKVRSDVKQRSICKMSQISQPSETEIN